MQACDAQSQKSLTAKAYHELSNAGAHFVIDSLVDISPILNEINARLARGERP